jgi:hypothetical protein
MEVDSSFAAPYSAAMTLPPAMTYGSLTKIRFTLRLESECLAEVVQGGANLVKRSGDGVAVKSWPVRAGFGDEWRKRAEETNAGAVLGKLADDRLTMSADPSPPLDGRASPARESSAADTSRRARPCTSLKEGRHGCGLLLDRYARRG